MTPLSVFPIDPAARASFRDDFGAARSGGRRHAGTDIFTNEGTPVLAVVPGTVRFDVNELGGNVAYLTALQDDGTWFYYAHLLAPGGAGGYVVAGETIGRVGRTGNAAHTAAHLHFEIHPGGGAPVDPFGWLVDVARVPSWGRSLAWIAGSVAAASGLGAALRVGAR